MTTEPELMLLVEDEEAHAELVLRAFEGDRERVRVTRARTIREAERALESHRPAIVLTDLKLPDGLGTDLLERCGSSPFALIVMTSHGDEQAAVEAIKAGAIDYVVKSDVLFASMPRVVERARREFELASQKRLAEEELRRTKDRLDEAQRLACIGSWEIDITTGRSWCSEEARRIFGQGRFEGPSCPPSQDPNGWMQCIHPEDQERLGHWLDAVREGAAPGSLDARVLLADGGERDVCLTAQRHRDARRAAVRLAGTVQDVTDRKRLEDELRHAQKMEAIGTLASGIAHDFNNLLMGIAGTADVALARAETGRPVAQQLGEIRGAVRAGATITRELVTFARRRPTERRAVAIDDVVGAMESILRRLISESIQLEVTTSAPGAHVRCDPGQLQHVVMNLAVNARDAMSNGGSLRISTSSVADGVSLVVADTGTGMDARTKARIFEPFFTTKPVGKGTGLGLATVYGIVRETGGTIEVDSVIGRGTSFRIVLPCAAPDTAGPASVASCKSHDNLRGRSILIVEDEPLVRAALRHYLETAGVDATDAPSADAALGQLERAGGRIDLVLSDVMLPGRSGAELERVIAARWPEVRVVLMSAHPPGELRAGARVRTETRLLQKPFEREELLETLASVLAKNTGTPAEAARPATILLIEDHDLARTACRELLQEEHYIVHEAVSGAEGLRLLLEHPVDLVVTDLGLPDMSAGEIVARLREARPGAAVLILSGREPDDPEITRWISEAQVAFMGKPIELDAFLGRVGELLRSGRARVGGS
ncbi:MAG: response regulator [Sandaracinaceae bacterium]|nr:response regulator [Sandaracinaceae bacterium]